MISSSINKQHFAHERACSSVENKNSRSIGVTALGEPINGSSFATQTTMAKPPARLLNVVEEYRHRTRSIVEHGSESES